LYKAWKSEIDTREPQSLPNDFYQKTDTYLNGLEREIGSIDEHSARGRLTHKEKEIGDRLLHELKQIRLRKLLELAERGETINEANLADEEKLFVQDFIKSLQDLRQTKVKPEPAPTEEKVELLIVRFLQDIPEIVGTDLKIYGPYKKEDIGSLPDSNARALVRQGAAKEIEVRGIMKPAKN
jgi:DNA replication factor GINS